MSLQNSRSAFPSTPGTTNKALLQRVREGDEQAWNEFYCKYLNMIRKAGRRQGLSPEECQDLMTEVMVIFWRKMAGFIYTPEKGRFRSYLNRIADFVSLKMHRANRRHAQAPEVGDYPEYVDTGCMNEWRDYLLEKALEDLRANVDTVTYMAFHLLTFQHRTVKEVAAITGKRANTIYGMRFRCMERLKAFIAACRELDEAELARRKKE